MRARRLFLLVVSTVAISASLGCSSGDDGEPATGTPFDGGIGGPDTSFDGSPQLDASSPDGGQVDASPLDASQDDAAAIDSSASDAAGSADGALPPIACAAPQVIDSAHDATFPVRAASLPGGKTVVLWGETTGHTLKARYHDGASWQTEHAFAASAAVGGTSATLAADGLGNAIAMWVAYTATPAYAAVMSPAGVWGSETTLSAQDPQFGQATFATGGGALLLADPSGVSATIYSAGTSSWSGLSTLEAGFAASPRLATNAAGKLAALWYKASGTGTHQATLSLATYEGGAWSSVVSHVVGAGGAGASASGLDVGVYANGDLAVAWSESDPTTPGTYVQRYQVGNGTWAQPAKVYDGAAGPANVSLFVDAADRVTLVFPDASVGGMAAVRDTGSGFSAPVALGGLPAGDFGDAKMDPATGNIAVLLKLGGNVLGVTRAAAGSADWEAPVASQLASGLAAGLAFDGARAVIASAQGAPSQVEVAVCE